LPLSFPGRPDRAAAIRTIHAALDAGVRVIDTADAYCLDASELGHGELLVAEALATWSGDASEVLVATKGGHTRGADGSWDLDGRPEHLRAACEASLGRLGGEAIGLYQLHRPDPKVPFEESVGALRELRDAGLIRMAGVSNVDEAQIRAAREIAAVEAVQNELSPAFRSSEGELALCERLGIAFLPWSPFGGIGKAGRLGEAYDAFAEVAREHDVSPQRVCLAWLLAKSPALIAIPGASRPETILDSVAAAELQLTDDELARLDAATGGR
ncbi:MAG TPA: aldo/keto reductase, partial [Capillimicrobium sp.]|nr:aldo/keto reductase [Capillimicrobium sp.]